MICFSRIDDRLIHGQVVTTWVNAFNIEQIVILNDKIADDKTQKNILAMAAPQGIKVKVYTIKRFAEVIKTAQITRRTMLLFTTSVDVLEAVMLGVDIPELNIGGMRYQEGRERVTRALSVTSEERTAFKQLLDKNIKITVQMVPKDEKVDLKEVI